MYEKFPGLKKKPSTSELIDWLKLLMADDIPEDVLKNHDAKMQYHHYTVHFSKTNRMFTYWKS